MCLTPYFLTVAVNKILYLRDVLDALHCGHERNSLIFTMCVDVLLPYSGFEKKNFAVFKCVMPFFRKSGHKQYSSILSCHSSCSKHYISCFSHKFFTASVYLILGLLSPFHPHHHFHTLPSSVSHYPSILILYTEIQTYFPKSAN